MSVQIIEDKEGKNAVLDCNTTEWAFGPVFNDGYSFENWPGSWQVKTAGEIAREFLRWHGQPDVRTISDKDLAQKHSEFIVAVSEDEVPESDEE